MVPVNVTVTGALNEACPGTVATIVNVFELINGPGDVVLPVTMVGPELYFSKISRPSVAGMLYSGLVTATVVPPTIFLPPPAGSNV